MCLSLWNRRVALVGIVGVSAPAAVAAQGLENRVRVVATLSGAILQTSNRAGGMFGIGGGLGIERAVSSSVAMRALITGYRAVAIGDNAFVSCPVTPCPISVFPDWLVVGELQGLVSLDREQRWRMVGGAGVALPIGGREKYRGAPSVDSTASPRATLRAGLEWRMGGNAAPRIQLTRSAYTKSIFSLDWLDAFAIAVPF